MRNEITTTKRVVKHGNTLGINLREEAEWLGIEYGDLIEVTFKPMGRKAE